MRHLRDAVSHSLHIQAMAMHKPSESHRHKKKTVTGGFSIMRFTASVMVHKILFFQDVLSGLLSNES